MFRIFIWGAYSFVWEAKPTKVQNNISGGKSRKLHTLAKLFQTIRNRPVR